MKIRRQLKTKQPPDLGLHFGLITMAVVGALTPNKHRQVIAEEAIAATVALRRDMNKPDTVIGRRVTDAKRRRDDGARSEPAV